MSLLPPLFLQAVTGDPAISYTAQDMRLMLSALAPHPGTVLVGDLQVAQRAAGANMSVDVAAGRAVVAGTSIADQGSYIVRSTATENRTIATADPTNPRIDLVVAQVFDKQADGGTQYAWTPRVVTGTPATSPVAPALPANALRLALVRVNAGATSIGTANIFDRRVLSGLGDVPQWDYSGTADQSIPHATDTVYAPTNLFRRVGLATTATVGELVCITPGRYNVHFGAQFSAGGAAGQRNVSVRHYASDGTTLIRAIYNSYPSNDLVSLAAGGNLLLSAGDRIRATIYQASGGALTITDLGKSTLFTGVWLGP